MLFTQTRLATLKCPPGKKDAVFFDDTQRGLCFRVLASGSKSYFAQYTDSGIKRRIPLGSFAGITLAQARAAVQAIQGDRARGIDPMLARKQAAAASQALTLGELLDSWHTLHLNGQRASYAKEATTTLRRLFAVQLSGAANSLGRSTIIPVIDKLSRAGSDAMAAAAVSYGRSCYGWALRRGTVDANPFINIPVAAPVRRERVLSDDELRAVWNATAGPGPFEGIVRLLILTGQRRDEVGSMTWAELSDDLSTWAIPAARTKNGRAHIVPLPEAARLLLASTPRIGDPVFPGRGDGPFNGFAKSKRVLDAKSGVKDWRLHDLRRTAATGLQRLGVRLEVTEAVLNHVGGARGGITGVYQRHGYREEKAAALEAWGAHVMAVIKGRKLPANVTKLRAVR